MTQPNIHGFEDYCAALRSAPLLAKCGGPYPNSEYLKPIPWKEAKSKLNGYAMDVSLNPRRWLEIERMMAPVLQSIWNEATKNVGAWKKFWGAPYDLTEETQMMLTISNKVTSILPPTQESGKGNRSHWDWMDCHGADCALDQLLVDIGTLIYFSRIDELPILKHATRLVMEGYLPLDIEYVEKDPKLLVY